MTSLIDDLRHAPTPLALFSRETLVEAVKAAQVVLLQAGLHQSDHPSLEGTTIAELRRYSLWLEDVALQADGYQAGLLSAAASISEFTAGLVEPDSQLTIWESPLNDLLRSAILSSLTPYQAHPTVIGRRVVDALAGQQTSSSVEQCHLLVASIIAALLGRQFHYAFDRSVELRRLIPAADTELHERDAGNLEILALDRALALGLTAGTAAAGMFVGAPHLVRQTVNEFESIRRAAAESEDAQRYWLADRLRPVVARMYAASMHRVLAEAGVSYEYRRALARDGVFEFWNPQLEAIGKGLLDPRNSNHFVISVPTGAGKTLFAELALVTALRAGESGWAVYIAPTRALVNQISADLRRRLESSGITVRTIMAGAEQSVILGDELDLLTVNRTVTVTTPEKLDAYYRNAKDVFDSCKLAIFDEVHKLGDVTRGALIESLITRFMVFQPSARLVLMSGVMTNTDELVSWLGAERTTSVVTQRRPTRQLRGVTMRTALTPRAPRSTVKGTTTRRVDFAGGLVVVHEEDDLTSPVAVDVPDLFRGHYTERSYPGRWWENPQSSHSSVNDHAIQVAQRFAPLPGTILVFVQMASWAESSARRFSAPTDAYIAERQRLADFLVAELGPRHDLPDLCRRGVAYHHARLPHSVQRALEFALERGWLKVVFATPTLREGLNTPATTVILAGSRYWDEAAQSWQPIAETDFVNLAGRAGRPRQDTEGRVILIPEKLASATEVGKKYILVGDEALRVISQFRDLDALLDQAGADLMSLPPAHQSLILALRAAGLTDQDGIATFLGQLLWVSQEEDETALERTVNLTSAALQSAEKQIGVERLDRAARLGLSLVSAERLFEVLQQQQAIFTPSGDSVQDRDSQLLVLIGLSVELYEIRRGILASDVVPTAHLPPLKRWLGGDDYHAILEAGRATGVLKENSDLGDAVRYASDFSTWLSWSFGAASALLNDLFGEIDAYLAVLPLMVRYGVPGAAAAYVALLGVTDRTAARVLGERFERTGKPVTLAEVSKWLQENEDAIDDIFPEHEHHLRAELVKRQTARAGGWSVPFIMSRFPSKRRVASGSVLNLRSMDGILFLADGEELIAEISDGDRVVGFAAGQMGNVSAIVTSEPHRTEPGTVAIIRHTSAQ